MAYGADLGSSQIFNMNLEDIKLELYAVVNQEGKFFRAVGYGGYGPSWVDSIEKAKLYGKLGQARSRVTYWFTNHPKFGMPKIIKLSATGVEVIDEVERVGKAKEKKEMAEIRYKKQMAEWNLQQAENKLKEAEKEIARLKKKK